MAKRRIIIPEGVKCNECGSTDLRGAGREWKSNPNKSASHIVVQKFRCKNCGKIFLDGEVVKTGGMSDEYER